MKDTKLKISMISPDAIRRHQANTSKSKFACSFSRDKRFSNPNPECKQAFYVKNQTSLSNIKFKVPKSNRSDFTKDLTCSPPSTKYLHKSSFQRNPSKGKSFALGRDSSPDRSYLIPQLTKVPGPGNYQNQVNTRSTISFSLRPKTSDFDGDRLSFKKAPGPGQYNTIELNPKNGRFNLSKLRDTKLCKINPNTKRFLQEKTSPGPFNYVRSDEFSKEGHYFLSKDRSTGRRPFTRASKINFTEKFRDLGKTIPGPGAYDKPSDFGVYGDINYYHTLSHNS